MKKRILGLLLCLLLLPSLSRGGEADPLSEVNSFVDTVVRNAVHAAQVAREESAEPPRVIDHINHPELWPDFAFDPGAELLEIWFPSIRDQDAAILLYQDQVWMLDCGDERARNESVPLLKYLNISRIDRLINTHPHHDHLNGLYAIDAEIPVSELMICFPEDATLHMTAAMEYCKGSGIRVTPFGDEAVLPMGDGFVTMTAWLKVAGEESVNDRSAQFMLSYGLCDMLFMADMELRGQAQLFEALPAESLAADILRYPHHGKKYMNDALYSAIDPQLVIVTNSPRISEIWESTHFLDNKHANVAYTHRGNYLIHLTTDGRHWLCEEETPDLSPWQVRDP